MAAVDGHDALYVAVMPAPISDAMIIRCVASLVVRIVAVPVLTIAALITWFDPTDLGKGWRKGPGLIPVCLIPMRGSRGRRPWVGIDGVEWVQALAVGKPGVVGRPAAGPAAMAIDAALGEPVWLRVEPHVFRRWGLTWVAFADEHGAIVAAASISRENAQVLTGTEAESSAL